MLNQDEQISNVFTAFFFKSKLLQIKQRKAQIKQMLTEQQCQLKQ